MKRKPIRLVTRKDIYNRVAALSGLDYEEAKQHTDTVLLAMRSYFEEADPDLRMEIRSFGVFRVRLYAPGEHGRSLVPRRIVKFTASIATRAILGSDADWTI